jgi:hypothetical protein
MPNEANQSQALFRVQFPMPVRVTHTIQLRLHSKVLETCLPMSSSLFHPSMI